MSLVKTEIAGDRKILETQWVMKPSEPLTTSRQARAGLMRRLFPHGVPRLWCPTLTHFVAQGQFDEPRIRQHLQRLAPYVKGDGDVQQLLGVVLDAAQAADIRILVGALKTDLPSLLRCMDATVAFLQQRAGVSGTEEALQRAKVVGFTVCPPKGSQLDQETIAEELSRVAERGLPLALYQLPQVTGNEMSPATVQALAARHPGFYLFKDTSGKDCVAESKLDLDGVFLVRGAEGTMPGGPNSRAVRMTASCSARPMCLRANSTPSCVCSNKVLDHLMAHGEAGVCREPPLLYSGVRLPAAFVESAVALLRRNTLMPASGYLE